MNKNPPDSIDQKTPDSVDQDTPVFDKLGKSVGNIRRVLALVLALGLATPALPSKAEAGEWSGRIDFSEQKKALKEEIAREDQKLIKGRARSKRFAEESERLGKEIEQLDKEIEQLDKEIEQLDKEANAIRESAIQTLIGEYVRIYKEMGYIVTPEQARPAATKCYDEHFSRVKRK